MKNSKAYTEEEVQATQEAQDLLVEALGANLVTRAEVAAACGASKSSVCRWAHRQMRPNIEYVPALTKLLRERLAEQDPDQHAPDAGTGARISEAEAAFIRQTIREIVTEELLEAVSKVVDLAKHNQEWQDRITTRMNQLAQTQSALRHDIATAMEHADRTCADVSQIRDKQADLLAYCRQLRQRSVVDRITGRMPMI